MSCQTAIPCGGQVPECMCDEYEFYRGPEYCKDSTHDHTGYVYDHTGKNKYDHLKKNKDVK